MIIFDQARMEGKRDVLPRLLARKHGSPSDQARQRLEAMSWEQLDNLFDQIMA